MNRISKYLPDNPHNNAVKAVRDLQYVTALQACGIVTSETAAIVQAASAEWRRAEEELRSCE